MDVLRLLANSMNQDILGVLAVEPAFPRRIAALLGYAESEVSRRLRAFEKAGLVTASWERQENNVKVYSLARRMVTIRITPTGLEVSGQQGERADATADVPDMPAPTVTDFVGRDDVLAALEKAPVTILEGLPGIGKSSILAKYAQGRDALWVTCRGVETLTWLANQAALHLARRGRRCLLDAVEAGTPGPGIAALLLEELDRPGSLVVLDDAHALADPLARSWLDDALARFQQGRLIVAGRERIAHKPRADVQYIRVEGLDDVEALALLRQHGVDVGPELLQRVRDEVGGHPLALMLLAQAAHDGGLEPLLDRRPEQDLTEYLLEEIDAGLTDGERAVLAHAALFRREFRQEELESLCGRRLQAPLIVLRRRHLVLGADSMRLHEVVRNFYASRVQDKQRLHRKAAEQCLARETVEGHLEALHHLLEAGDRAQVLRLIGQDIDLRDFEFVDSGYHRLYQEILAGFTREEVDDDGRWAQILDELADIEYHAGDPERALAYYEEADQLFARVGDEGRRDDVGWKRALCLEALQRPQDALRVCEEAMSMADDETTRKRLERLQTRLAA